jgi:hypothetical protein
MHRIFSWRYILSLAFVLPGLTMCSDSGEENSTVDSDSDADPDSSANADADTNADADADADTDTAGTGCTVGPWPTADPSTAGPFETVTELNVGPAAGEAAEGEDPPHFTLFRPADMTESDLCHPVITWGNGTGADPSMYGILLSHFASHGFVVIASDSPNVARGDPPPMVVGVTWVLEQNDDPDSVMYQRIDTTHIGATGHSQGGMATTMAAGDSHIVTMVPLCGAMSQRNLSGPAMFFCGGLDDTVPCSSVENAFNAVTDLPAMLAEYVSAGHADYFTFWGSGVSSVETAVTAWMRLHLMDDTTYRSWFYGASCELCQDSEWNITQKNMDQ